MTTLRTIVLLTILLVSFNLQAQKRLEKIVKSGELRVGMTGNQPPFSMKLKSGEMIGFDVDLANLLATSMELEVKLVEMPFGELLPSLQRGDIDLVISGMTISLARNLQTAFVGPYLISGKSILTKQSHLANATNPGDIDTGLKVIALEGSTSQRFAEKYLTNVDLNLVKDVESGFQKIINDESDVMIADYPTCAFALLKYPDQNLVALNRPMTIEPIGIALHSDDALFINALDNYLESLLAAGVIEMMEEKWFENPYWLLQLQGE